MNNTFFVADMFTLKKTKCHSLLIDILRICNEFGNYLVHALKHIGNIFNNLKLKMFLERRYFVINYKVFIQHIQNIFRERDYITYSEHIF